MVEIPVGFCLTPYIEGRKAHPKWSAEARVFTRLYDRLGDRNQKLFRDSWLYGGNNFRGVLVWGEFHIFNAERHSVLIGLARNLKETP
jgi:hypothetical protein